MMIASESNHSDQSNRSFSIRREYDPTKYIFRPQIEIAQSWLNERKKQLLTVSSPPATGKTWFLQHLKREFDRNGTVKALWLEVDDLTEPHSDDANGRRTISATTKAQWFQNFLNQLTSQCPELNHVQFNQDEDISERIEKLTKEICQTCFFGKQVVLIIDNGDLLSDPDWHQFERTVIEPFAREGLLRLIVAMREDQKIQTVPLSWSQQRLLLGDLDSGQNQIAVLSQEFPQVVPQVNRLLGAIPAYKQNHPGLNTFLFLFAEKYPDTTPSIKFFRILLDALNLYPEENLLDQLIDYLSEIADYANEWVIEELAAWQNVSNTEAWNRAQLLIDHHLVVNISHNRYKVADGIREFARASLELETAVSIEITSQDTPENIEKQLEKDISTLMPNTATNILSTAVTADKVTISVEMPSEEANQLVTLHKEKKLDIQGVTHITPKPAKLRQLMAKHINLEELQIVTFDLDIEYENLAGATLNIKIISLLKHCKRYGRLTDLLALLQQERPDVLWDS